MFWRRRGATMRHCKDWLNDAMMIPEAKKAPLAVNRSVLKLKVFRKSQISGFFFGSLV